jgi:phenylpropionate dioxygenase-like ring-hydroxylating dioxygenase large terminal subunit
MFEGFARVWTPVIRSARVRERPVRVELAGERLALFRDREGGLGALVDRCPHRGVSLSLGKVTREGCLACPFHGWEFDRAGRNVHVPFNPDAKRERLGTIAVPAIEAAGLVWIHTAPLVEGAAPPAPPALAEGLARADVRRTYTLRDWPVHWTRAMENMLDSPHVPFVHRATIGRARAATMDRGSRMTMRWIPAEHGARIGMQVDAEAEIELLEFHAPNLMVLKIPIPGRFFRMHAFCVPMSAGATRMIVVGARDFARAAILDPFFGRTNAKILAEDEHVLATSDPPEVPEPSEERSVASDAPTLAFRKYYYEALRDSRA